MKPRRCGSVLQSVSTPLLISTLSTLPFLPLRFTVLLHFRFFSWFDFGGGGWHFFPIYIVDNFTVVDIESDVRAEVTSETACTNNISRFP